MSKKISFPEPSCRYSCPHFKTVGSLLNETHSVSYTHLTLPTKA